MALDAVLKLHGGKFRLARRLVAAMPAHANFVDVYGGSAAVLLAHDPEGCSEVYNDLDHDLVSFWRVLQGEASFTAFQRLCAATPFSEALWQDVRQEFREWPVPDENVSDAVVRAWRFFILARQSLAGRQKNFAALTVRRRRGGMNEQVSAWLRAVDGLPAVHERLRRVLLLHRPALEVIQKYDHSDTLYYMDPPYLPSTRTARKVYRQEMSEADHEALLALIVKARAKIMLSGYANPLYDRTLSSWRRTTFEVPCNAAQGKSKGRRVEVVWSNFA